MSVSDAPASAPGDPVPGDALVKTQLHDLLWEVATYSELMGEAALADTPLTLPSNGLLVTVVNEPGITVAEISRGIPKTQQAISQITARLERLGFVERRLGSGRGVGLHATAAGTAAAREGVARELAFDERLRELLGAERFTALLELLAESRDILREVR